MINTDLKVEYQVNSNFDLYGPPKVITAKYMETHKIKDGIRFFSPMIGPMAYLQQKEPILCKNACLTSTVSKVLSSYVNNLNRNSGLIKIINNQKSNSNNNGSLFTEKIEQELKQLDDKFKDGFEKDVNYLNITNKKIAIKLTKLLKKYGLK